MTKVNSGTPSAILKTLKVQVVDTKVCRRKTHWFQDFHICTTSFNKALKKAPCDVSNIIGVLLEHFDPVSE